MIWKLAIRSQLVRLYQTLEEAPHFVRVSRLEGLACETDVGSKITRGM